MSINPIVRARSTCINDIMQSHTAHKLKSTSCRTNEWSQGSNAHLAVDRERETESNRESEMESGSEREEEGGMMRASMYFL